MRLFTLTAILLASCSPFYAAAADMHGDAPPENAHYTPIPDSVANPASSHEMQDPDAENNVQDPDAEMPGDVNLPDAIPNTPVQNAPGVTTPPTTATDTTTPPATSQPKPPSDSGDTHFDMVMLQGLNKVTARAESIEAPIGSVVRYGTIEIIAHKCWKSDPDQSPENAALLEVSEIKQGEAPQRIFSGWMFSSTPALASLEHPFYDLNVIACGKESAKP